MFPKDPDNEPWSDEIVAETRARREELFAAAGHNIEQLARHLKESKVAEGHEVVRFAPRRVESNTDA